METIRKPFQGVLNIIRFNWHFYILAGIIITFLLVAGNILFPRYLDFFIGCSILILVAVCMGLATSFYIYDCTNLYQLKWIKPLDKAKLVVNIHAGFDETSVLLKAKFKHAKLQVFDFYDANLHTELSIKRARKAYPTFPNTQHIRTQHIPIADAQADDVFIIFAAHEIRNETERIQFFKELHRITKADGCVYVTEHLRDGVNFLAYQIGFFHFLSKKTWLKTFASAKFNIQQEIKVTPFISTFILQKQ